MLGKYIITSKKVKKFNLSEIQKIIELALQNNGTLTSAMVSENNLSRGILKYLADEGKLEKVSRGVYVLPGNWEDEFVCVQNRFKKGIYSLQTALYFNDLTDRTPNSFYMAFPATYNLTGPKREGIICSGSKEPLYSLGITDLKTPQGNYVKGYNAERTLCDILKPRNHTDIQIVTEALKIYTSRREKNIPLLSEYAHQLRVEEKLRAYLEVLL